MQYNSSTGFRLLFFLFKLDRVGPVDNRPSTEDLHNFAKKIFKNIYINLTCESRRKVDILSKFQVPSSHSLE